MFYIVCSSACLFVWPSVWTLLITQKEGIFRDFWSGIGRGQRNNSSNFGGDHESNPNFLQDVFF